MSKYSKVPSSPPTSYPSGVQSADGGLTCSTAANTSNEQFVVNNIVFAHLESLVKVDIRYDTEPLIIESYK